MKTETLPVTAIRTDGGTQPRTGIRPDLVAEYAEAMMDGAEFPPVAVFHDGEGYWLADGFHRVGAAQVAERGEILAEVHEGSKRDAILHAAGANADHGWRRSNEDKRHAVMKLLLDEEWSGWSDREIARRCKVSHETVRRLRGSICHKMTDSRPRKVRRNGAVYEQDTANIGKPSPPEPAPQTPEPESKPEEQEMATWDPVAKRWNDPWAGEKREKFTRRQRVADILEEAKRVIRRIGENPREAVDLVLKNQTTFVSNGLDEAVDWLSEFRQAWREKHD